MFLLAFNLTLLEILILQIGAIILGITIYFFWTSHKALSETLKKSRSKLDIAPTIKKTFFERFGFGNSTLDEIEQRASQVKNKLQAEVGMKRYQPALSVPANQDAQVITSLKDALLRQQETLNTLLTKIDSIDISHQKKEWIAEKEELEYEKDELEKKIEKLELQLDNKDGEIRKIKQQEAAAQQMASRIDEVYKEFDLLQKKMTSLEKQANRANALALELQDARQETDQLRKDLDRKQEKLEELITESQRLHATLGTTEDKLAEANLQRQQLYKKVQFLQDINNDMQHVTESNQKLQNELRRIGELESMLNMIAEERDRLLNKDEKQ
jgi:chromosome segregation ATPase